MSQQTNISPHTEADRRLLIIAATWRVIIQQGISAASLRTIAREMDATTGLVTRYFPEKQGLMVASLEAATGVLNNALAKSVVNLKSRARLEAVVLAALPASGVRLRAWQLWVAFIAEIPAAPELKCIHMLFPDSLRKHLVQGLREAQLEGRITREAYPPQLADTLMDQIIGIGVRAITEPARYRPERLPGQIALLFARIMEKPD